MKKFYMAAVTLTVVLMASSAFAGFPQIKTGNSTMDKITNKAVDMGKNKAIVSEINKKIAKHNCTAFQSQSVEVASQCNWDALVSDLKTYKDVLGATGIADLSFYIKAHGPEQRDSKKGNFNAYDRGSHVQKKLYGNMNWWSYSVQSIPDNTDKLELIVEAK